MFAGRPAPPRSDGSSTVPDHHAQPLDATSEVARPHVLDDEVFRGFLIRERKRADRCDQPFLLILVELGDRQGIDRSATWQIAIDALAAVKRKTDVVGWFDGSIGVILPEVRAAEIADARKQFATRFGRELAIRSDAETASRLSMRVHVYPEPACTEGDELCPADPILFRVPPSGPAGRTIPDAIKRGLDISGSATLLIVLLPLLLLIAALVKLRSRGPSLYEQVRIGQDMKPFRMLKFRTMYVDADHGVHREFVSAFINASRQAAEPGNTQFFKLTSDPRITPVGHILRKTSLDELPQLWNVLRGDMSLVGPRPALPYELEQYRPWHRRRMLEAKPGITGLWQVTGRSRTTFDEMVRLDLRYARTCSLWTDIKILLATPAAVISGRGAC
jgi:lipopolysaccharide/colanic/teichoic acid biosynthesis glycosyltransferase